MQCGQCRKGEAIMAKSLTIIANATGIRNVIEKWILEDLPCELVVSRNEQRKLSVKIIYDIKDSNNLRTLLLAAKGNIIELK